MCCLSLHVVLCRNAFSFSTVSVKGLEKKTHSCCFCLLLYGYSVSCCPSSLWNISFPAFPTFLISIGCQVYLLTNHFRNLSSRATLFIQLITPSCFNLFSGIFIKSFIYPIYNKQTEHGKLLIALFSPLFVIVFKVILRLCAQRLKNIVHPGYSYTLLGRHCFPFTGRSLMHAPFFLIKNGKS